MSLCLTPAQRGVTPFQSKQQPSAFWGYQAGRMQYIFCEYLL